MSKTPRDQERRNLFDSGRPPLKRRYRALAVAITVGVHLLVVLAVIASLPQTPRMVEPEAVIVTLAAPLLQPEPPAPPARSRTRPKPPRSQRKKAAKVVRVAAAQPAPRRPVARRPTPEALPQGEAEKPTPTVELTDAQLEGAITAGSDGDGGGGGGGEGGGGRNCDMVRRLQNALRRDARVQAAIAEAHRAAAPGGRAVLVWNGDWIRSASEDGKGLAGVRQAIMVEVGFAPEACRSEPVHGVVLISLNDAPGSPRVALGGGHWRWTDLLFARGVPMTTAFRTR